MGDHFWLFTKLDNTTLKGYANKFNCPEKQSLELLTQTISTNPCWKSYAESAIVYRNTEQGGYLSVCTESAASLSSEIQTQLNFLCRSVQQIQRFELDQCTALTASLAEKIKQTVDTEVLRKSRVISIPRGGLFVTAMLSYLLPLQHQQLENFNNHDCPVILIDDCAISGLRLRQQLDKLHNPQIYFFTLGSPLELRTAALKHETRLCAFESVMDVTVYSDQTGLPTDNRYWQGQCDALCFPWAETQRYYTPPSATENTVLWPVSPRNSILGGEEIRDSIQVHGVNECQQNALSTCDHILYYSDDQSTRIYDTKSGRQYSLDPVASLMWQSLLDNKNLTDAANQLQSVFDVEPEVLVVDMQEFVSKLRQCNITQTNKVNRS